jgi:hypothetical protein
MKQDYSDVTNTQNQSLSDVKEFVKKLNALPEMTVMKPTLSLG